MCQDEYYIGGESVHEDTFWQQIDTYEMEEVTGYEPKQHEQNPERWDRGAPPVLLVPLLFPPHRRQDIF